MTDIAALAEEAMRWPSPDGPKPAASPADLISRLRAALVAQEAKIADAWDEGYMRGRYPWKREDEEEDPRPAYTLPPTFGRNANPYRRALSDRPPADHPHSDPGDGRTQCPTCGKWVWMVTHSCKGVRVVPTVSEEDHG
jgi:hypothetical protein